MKKQIILLYFLILYIVDISSTQQLKYIASKFTKELISLEYDITGPYYSSWTFYDYKLNFQCTNKNATTRSCDALISIDISKQLYGDPIIFGCIITPSDGTEGCNSYIYSNYFPTPIVEPEFKVPTKGGIVSIQGYFLKFTSKSYYKIKPDLNIYMVSTIVPYDPTNIGLRYQGGCGQQTFLWENGQNYTFNHFSPLITNSTINESSFVIDGSNFCNITGKVSIYLDNDLIENSNITSLDHDSFEINHSELYAKKSNIKIVSGGLPSNEYQILFKPIPAKVNSLPSVKGGVVTILGPRLSGDPKINFKTIVKIGNSNCNNVISYASKITCELTPLLSNELSIDLPVSISIDGVENEVKLLFSYDVPIISDYILPQGVLTLKGDCLGTSSTSIIYLNGQKQENITINVNSNQTTLSFQIPSSILKSNISIFANGKISNTVIVDASFYAIVSDSSPSVNGQNVNYEIHNIKATNIKLSPKIIILPDNIEIIGTIINKPNSPDPSTQTYSFAIPKGCGRKDIIITLGDQSSKSTFNYESPIITNCLIGGVDSIICNGNFTDFTSYFTNEQLNINFSNQTIQNQDIKFNSTVLSFPLKPNYESSDLVIQLCDIQSIPITVNILPEYDVDSLFGSEVTLSTIGGYVIVNGKNYNRNIIENTFFTCMVKNVPTRFNCTYSNYNLINCPLNIPGPKSTNCKFTFNNVTELIDQLKIKYAPPVIIQINQINPVLGGIITITGSQFYDSIDEISIDNQPCSNPKFISSSIINCYFPPNNSINSNNTQIISVSINGKSSNSVHLNIFSNSPVQGSKKDTEINNEGTSSKKKINYKLISLITIPVGLGLLGYFVVFKQVKKHLKEKKNKNAIKNARNEREMRRANPPPELPEDQEVV